jgi:MGT family glycosyltransferase
VDQVGYHIAFFNVPDFGHVSPTLPIVAELVDRGHRVSYVTVAERRDALHEAGATCVPYESRLASDHEHGIPAVDSAEFFGRVLVDAVDEATAMLPQIAPVYARDRPDLVAFDSLAFAGRAFSLARGIPSVRLWAVQAINERWSMINRAAMLGRGGKLYREYLTKCARLVAETCPGITLSEFLNPPTLPNIAFFSRTFQDHGEWFGANYHFVAPCIAPNRRTGGWSPPSDGRRIVLGTQGTYSNRTTDFFRLCVEAVSGTPWHVVLTTGRRIDPATVGPVPNNVEVHRWLPHLDVLPHAAVFLSHGGMTSVTEALSAGVPLVIVPTTPEQEANGDRVERLGLGRRLSPNALSATTLRDAVAEVMADRDVAERVRRMRQELMAAGGARRAADCIEESVNTAPIGERRISQR